MTITLSLNRQLVVTRERKREERNFRNRDLHVKGHMQGKEKLARGQEVGEEGEFPKGFPKYKAANGHESQVGKNRRCLSSVQFSRSVVSDSLQAYLRNLDLSLKVKVRVAQLSQSL